MGTMNLHVRESVFSALTACQFGTWRLSAPSMSAMYPRISRGGLVESSMFSDVLLGGGKDLKGLVVTSGAVPTRCQPVPT